MKLWDLSRRSAETLCFLNQEIAEYLQSSAASLILGSGAYLCLNRCYGSGCKQEMKNKVERKKKNQQLHWNRKIKADDFQPTVKKWGTEF